MDVIFDVEQYPSFGGISRIVPALTRNSNCYSTLRHRPLLPQEKLEVMGLPVFVPEDFMFQIPFRHLVVDGSNDRLSSNDVSELMGNAMHVAAIGTVLMTVLGCTRIVEESRSLVCVP